MEIWEYFKGFDPHGFISDYIYEYTNDAEYNDLLATTYKNINKVHELQFFNNMENHPCLYGKITMFSNGDIGVCPNMPRDIIGNAHEEKLHKILEKGIQDKYWHLTLNKIDKCQDCSRRYGCLDCRAIERSQTNDLFGKKYCIK